MGAAAGTDVTYLSMVVMKDSLESGLRMLSDMARHPAFSQAEIERQRQQTLSALQVSFEDPEFVADAVFDRLVYGFHPYGLPHTGTQQSIAGITRDDLVAFHKKYFVPNNAILAVVGDVTAEEAFAQVKKVFGDWDRKDVPAEPFVEPPAPTRRLIVINKPDAVQTEVRVGHLGIPRKHPDYMAVNLAIRILGGEGSNRLHNVLRTQRGLTYGAQADMDTRKESGDFQARTNTRSQATAEVLKLIFDEFWRLKRDPVGERELADAKAYLTGSFPLTIETPDAIALQVLNVVFYDLPIEDLQSFRERVNAVTTADIERVAQTFLRPDRLSVVLVGDASAFGSESARGWIHYVRERGSSQSQSHDRRLQTHARASGRCTTAVPAHFLSATRASDGVELCPGKLEREGASRAGHCRQRRSRQADRHQEHYRDDQHDNDVAGGSGSG